MFGVVGFRGAGNKGVQGCSSLRVQGSRGLATNE